MKTADFEFLAKMLSERSGLMLTPDKVYLLESRLTPLARRLGLNGLDDLIQRLRTRGDEQLKRDVTNAMTTNESFFFRDQTPFKLFDEVVLPAMAQGRAREKRVRIWCAAGSTGQEPYSLAMMLKERQHKWAGWTFEILSTDIADHVLAKAKAGRYSQFEVQRGLPIQLLMKYFDQEGESWLLKPEIRNMVQFRNFNLLDRFSGLGRFDVVFCRNVLIYFDTTRKAETLEKIHGTMPSDGFLFLGAAETVLGITERFRPVKGQRGLYSPAS
ncbi:chemotaxis protein CheR [Rhodothalassium salexigens]|uniref:protein-glutamate O-methyltransferase n=1 Tax=Rhodothalassium salexigens DSM 2132 TaxID=1188247 RepID=A0A4R2PGG6_RHOSA|nr:protein-glutamate O-methyltransferase [Rhodothalassium salexigens]MBB4211618.1 chemotaxis protein methyltransferase CheR [Rhodothalassium salexigens DSM 2132]MBK1639569.1 chemotaxis protein CheR [Rhodothalassium salexigens DSM 2132]MBK5910985.1 chemotaxis protein CheR [Rhodothalassium salexigens]MBK5921236.1 chemotaxis protein CheR [Rhodothalassium salexigens]TCP34450.1 chemotaxis protein methyltransferase CheR [Rhodothalassium salexigens DSM 2132]